MRRGLAVVVACAVVAFVGCDPPFAPPMPPPGDPAQFELGPALYACDRWSPGTPGAPHRWGLFDLHFGRRGLDDPNDRPLPEHLAEIRQHNGRVLHEFNVPRVRAILQVGAVPELSAGVVVAVTDADRLSVDVSVQWDFAATDAQLEYIRTLGGVIENDYPAYLYGASRISATVPDSAIPLIRALDGVSYVEAHGIGCLSFQMPP